MSIVSIVSILRRYQTYQGTECLGDCPDAAYFGPHILEESDEIEMLRYLVYLVYLVY